MYMIGQAKQRHQYIVFTKLLASISRQNKFWELSREILGRKHGKFIIPVEHAQGEGTVPREAILRWENAFKSLLSTQTPTVCQPSSYTNIVDVNSPAHSIEIPISEDLTRQLIQSQKTGKASGPDGIPCEVLKNDICVSFLTSMFISIVKSLCIPTAWKMTTIVPLPKTSMKDPSNPLQYRSISLNRPKHYPQSPVQFLSNGLPFVSHYKYLGVILDEHSTFKEAAGNRLDLATKAFWSIQGVLSRVPGDAYK